MPVENSPSSETPLRQRHSSSLVVFLDRDGVINHERPGAYISTPEEWVPIPGSLDAIRRLCEAGYQVIVLTNQSGLGRGLLKRTDLEAIHSKLIRAVEDHGGKITGIFFCPHAPDEGCPCRKPRIGLIRSAESALSCTATDAPFIGDQLSDLNAARSAGCRPFLVRTGRGSEISDDDENLTDVEIYKDLSSAVDAIVLKKK